MATPDPRWRRTFWINFADLSLYWGGDAFASLSTVLPLFVSRLSDSTVLVGLVPALYWIGFIGPQVLAAGYVRKLPRKKPFAIAAFGVQRASMFALAAVTFALGGGQPKALLVAFLVLYTIGCIGIGAGIPPYQDMIAKVVPVEKRGRLRGWGVFAASALGVAAGFVARQVIEGQPFPRGFAICFAIAGALGTVSLLFASANREPAGAPLAEAPSTREFLSRLPGILRADTNFRSFTWSRVVFSLALMGVPFLPIYALSRFALPDEEVGALTAALMAGQMVSVLAMGFAADRYGHKVILQTGTLALAGAFALALAARSPTAMLVAFALAGCSNGAQQVSVTYIVLEMAPEGDRPAYVAMSSTVVAPVVVLAPLLGGWVVGLAGYGTLFSAVVALACGALMVLTLWVTEPRRRALAGRISGGGVAV